MAHKLIFSPVTGYMPSGDAVDVIQFLAEKVFQCFFDIFLSHQGRQTRGSTVFKDWLTSGSLAVNMHTHIYLCVCVSV